MDADDGEIDDEEELIDYEDMDIAVGGGATRVEGGKDVDGADDAIEEGELEDASAVQSPPPMDVERPDDPAFIALSSEDLRCAEHVCKLIQEPKKHLIRILIQVFGRDAASAALKETLRLEKDGGSQYEAGCEGSGEWKRRTKAGCFLHVFKRDADAAKISSAFARSKDIDKALRAKKKAKPFRKGR